MRSLPAVAGVLVLGFALVLFLSTFRQTRTHVYREAHGGGFALEVPRSWTVVDWPNRGKVETLSGPLPSGATAHLKLEIHPLSPSDLGGPRVPREEVRESPEGRFRLLRSAGLVPVGEPPGLRWIMTSLVRPGQRLDASWVYPADAPDADVALLERCARSLHWIGR